MNEDSVTLEGWYSGQKSSISINGKEKHVNWMTVIYRLRGSCTISV